MTETMQPTPDETLLDALRSNLRLLHELTMRYGVEIQPPRAEDDRPTIRCPDDVRQLVAPEMAGLAQEQVRILLLDSRNHVVGQRVIYQGNVNSAMVRPAEVLRPAVVAAIPHIIICHNHPSGDPTPSADDTALTRQLVEAADLLGVQIVDHVIIGGDGVVSLKEHGLMQ